MIKKGKGPADQEQDSERTPQDSDGRTVGGVASCQGNQPIGKRHDPERQGDAGQAMQYRQRIADLPAVDADMRRKRPGAYGHDQASSLRLEINTAAPQFPVPVPRGLRSLPAADFKGPSRPLHRWSVAWVDTLGAMRLFGHVRQIFATSHALKFARKRGRITTRAWVNLRHMPFRTGG